MSDYNPEADEISEDDLIAASDFYDRLVCETHRPCNDYAPDSWAPSPDDRDICTTCFYRAVAHETQEDNEDA